MALAISTERCGDRGVFGHAIVHKVKVAKEALEKHIDTRIVQPVTADDRTCSVAPAI